MVEVFLWAAGIDVAASLSDGNDELSKEPAVVEIIVRDGDVIFEPIGWSKLWTLHDPIRVPLAALTSVRRAAPDVGLGWWKGWRMPGAHIPGVIVAGTYRKGGEWHFWDVRGSGKHAIEVELVGEHYNKLTIDVADPEAELVRLQGFIDQRES